MRQGRLWSCVLLVLIGSSVALAGGPFGAPMSTLDPGQWAVDAGYWYEEMDADASAGVTEYYREWMFSADPNVEDGWGEWELEDLWEQRIVLESLETHTYVGSVEYGFCDNLDLYIRLGATSAEADLVTRDVDWDYDEELGQWIATVEKVKDSLDFGTGFTWQVGTRFTICQTGAWTWGGRLQFGMVDDLSGSSCYTEVSEVAENAYEVETEEVDADLDWWQAAAYIGPTYKLSDALQVYIAGGWQTLQGTIDIDAAMTDETYDVGGEVEELVERDQYADKGSFEINHASAIAVFGAAWAPTENINIGVDGLVGESGKWGVGISGAFAF